MCVLYYPVCRTEGGGTMMATPKMALKKRHGAVKVKKKDQQAHVPIDQQAVLVLGGEGRWTGIPKFILGCSLDLRAAAVDHSVRCPVLGARERGERERAKRDGG